MITRNGFSGEVRCRTFTQLIGNNKVSSSCQYFYMFKGHKIVLDCEKINEKESFVVISLTNAVMYGQLVDWQREGLFFVDQEDRHFLCTFKGDVCVAKTQISKHDFDKQFEQYFENLNSLIAKNMKIEARSLDVSVDLDNTQSGIEKYFQLQV